MILKALTLENFKGIREPVRIELAPLTLLFGPNNAGKSTIVQALMYAREVLECRNCDAGRTELGGDVVDLGGFRSLVHGHDLARGIRMRFELADVTLHDYIQAQVEDDLYDPSWLDFEDDSQNSPQGESIRSPSLGELTEGLSDYWVEIEISWISRAPIVTRYEVGTPDASLARIILNEDGRAGILAAEKKFSFVLDLDDLDRDLVERYWTAMEMVLDDDDPILLGLDRSFPRLSYSADGPDAEPPAPVHWQGRMREYRLEEDGIALHRWLRKLPIDTLAPSRSRGQWCVDRPLPLEQKNSALPPWKTQLVFDERLWQGAYEKNSTGEPELPNYFASENSFRDYLAGTISSLISGPGRCLVEALSNFVFLSAFREMPSRHGREVEPATAPSWASGRAAWDALISDNERLVADTNRWLTEESRLNSGYEICVAKHRELPEDGKLWRELSKDDAQTTFDTTWIKEQLAALVERRRLELVEWRTGFKLVPQDLGVGISQVIPVIVAALHSTSGVVAIEEPESNIHPAFQVVLADLFITQVKANPDVLFLIETHSEHLMLRCLRRIRETSEGEAPEDAPSLMPQDIAVHFVEPGDAGPHIHRIRIDEAGEFLDPWPRGFFRERAKELFG